MHFLLPEILLFSVLALQVGYLLFLAIAGMFYRLPTLKEAENTCRIAILVPAYKEDAVIISVAEQLLTLDYPEDLFDVVIIADSMQAETLDMLKALPIRLVEVSFKQSTKVKALNEALRQLPNSYDLALISDADNVLAPNALQLMNKAYATGFRAIQGRRVAKNADSSVALLDGFSEIINNHLFRRGFSALGLSSAIIGSGMAFDYSLFVELMQQNKAIGGFDKKLQLEVVRRGIRIIYLHNLLIYDEKVSDLQTFRQQRRRWLSSQWVYFKEYFMNSGSQLLKRNFDFVNLATSASLVLPRSILIGLLPMLFLVSLVLQPWLTLSPFWWFALAAALGLTLFLSIPKTYFNRSMGIALLHLPATIGLMFLNIFQLRGANKRFIHTSHRQTHLDSNLVSHGKE
jgi:cellulose synthase/poly-beta-1,6-N-acetylglucosamine synthase-like glycosyltransferase